MRQGRSRATAALWGLVLPALLAGGCGASYSTLQPGRVTPKGDFRLQAGMGAGLAPGRVGDLYDSGESAADNLVDYMDDEQQEACEGGQHDQCITARDLQPLAETLLMQVAAPLVMYDTHFAARYGLLSRIDLGLRYGGAGWMVDTRYQFLGDPEAGKDAWGLESSVGLGFSRRSLEYPSFLSKASEYLGLDENTRWDLRLPVLMSYRFGPYGYVYWGLGYMYSRWKIDIDPEFAYIDYLPDGSLADTADEIEQAFRDVADGSFAGTDTEGSIHQLTTVLGAFVGYKYVYVGLELNIITYWLDLEVMHKKETHWGPIFYPAASLLAEF